MSLAAIGSIGTCVQGPGPDSLVRLKRSVEEIIEATGAEVSLYYRSLEGTDSLLLAIAMSKASVKVLGGGHLGSLAAEMGISRNVHVSTGGGVLLALLGGEELPAISLLLKGKAARGKSRGGR